MSNVTTYKSFREKLLHFAFVPLLLASFIIAYYPVMEALAKAWWRSADYSHGFFIPPLFLYLIWTKREKLRQQEIRTHRAGLAIVLVSLLAYFIGHYAEIRTIASLSMIACLMGSVLYLLGPRILRELGFPFFLLFFMVPIPAQIYAKLTIPLQLTVTKVSALAAQTFGIPVYRTGNILETPGLSLAVVEACSGMRSIMTLLLLSALFAFFSLRTSIGKLALFLSGIPVAVLINIFRVTGIFLVWHFMEYDLTHGMLHKAFGIILFGIALVILYALQKGIVFWEEKPLSG